MSYVPEQLDLAVDGPPGDVDELLAGDDAPEEVDPEGRRRVGGGCGGRPTAGGDRVFVVDVSCAGEEGDAVAGTEREVAVLAGEVCKGEIKR